MIPILYSKTETSFTTNGIGRLSDTISCIVTEERNGAYELAMEYVEGGAHASDIDIDSIIFVKPAAYSTNQPFRVYKITKPLNKRFKIYARHISYDLANVIVMPTASYSNASTALAGMAANTTGMGGFSVGTVTVSATGTFQVTEPASFRNWIGGREGSILDVFGGELEWDKYTVKLWASRGTDRGLTLRYGKNISDISQERDNDFTVTGLVPYYKDSAEEVLTLPEKAVYKTGASYSTPTRLTNLDCQSMIDEQAIRDANPDDTEAQIEARLISAMRTVAQAYADANLSGVPDQSIEVAFVNLGDTEEYKAEKGLFTQAGICDTVLVTYERLGISVQSKIIKTEYNVLLERFEKLTIGKARTTLADKLQDITNSSITSVANASKHAADVSDFEAMMKALQALIDAKSYADSQDVSNLAAAKGYTDDAILEANAYATAVAAAKEAEAISAAANNMDSAIATNTALITGVDGGYVRLNRDGNGKPYEILIMDNPDINQAVKVWRWNINGLGYSSTGYNGTYTTALSMAGIFNTDFIAANTLSGLAIIAGTLDAGKITTGILNAALIKTGLLEDYAGKNSINMLTGQFSLCNGNFFYSLSDGDYIQLSNNLSLRLNGIPLAGQRVSSIGKNTSTGYAEKTFLKATIRPYDVIIVGQVKINNASASELVYDLPVIDGTPGYSSYNVVGDFPGYTVDGGGGRVWKNDPEILEVSFEWRRFNTEADFNAWASGMDYVVKVVSGGYIYGCYTKLSVLSAVAANEYINFTITYPRYQA